MVCFFKLSIKNAIFNYTTLITNLNGNILTYDESEDAYYIQHGADSVPKKLGSGEISLKSANYSGDASGYTLSCTGNFDNEYAIVTFANTANQTIANVPTVTGVEMADIGNYKDTYLGLRVSMSKTRITGSYTFSCTGAYGSRPIMCLLGLK